MPIVPVIEVADHTGFPEIMDGRVKTLHPKIHGGILARRDHAEDQAAMETHEIGPIDLIVINLYPFEATVASGAGYDDCVENIDIGGPAMIRAAAKNHAHVAVVTDPSDYDEIVAALDANATANFPPICADDWPPRPTPAPPPMTVRSQPGCRANWGRISRKPMSHPESALPSCGMVRTRTRPPRFISAAPRAPVSRKLSRFRARSSATTIWVMPTPPSSWPPNSTHPP